MCDELPLVLTVDQTSKLLGLSRGATYEAIRTGELPVTPIRIGRRILVPREPLLRLLGVRDADGLSGKSSSKGEPGD